MNGKFLTPTILLRVSFWMKNQTSGELDENKLIEGVTGEKNIYKKRTVPTSHNQGFGKQNKPKRILFVMDVRYAKLETNFLFQSASMYRFEGLDKRLTRLLESAVLIMESLQVRSLRLRLMQLQGFEERIDYAIHGHSGDYAVIPFCKFGNPPKNRKERLKILQEMFAHTQYCWTGDNTLQATASAMREV